MATHIVLALIHEENGVFGISFPDYPGCVSGGESMDEAVSKGHQALGFHLQGMVDDGEEVPEPSKISVAYQKFRGGIDAGAIPMVLEIDFPGQFAKDAEAAEDAADIAHVQQIKERLARGEEELIPADVVNRIFHGESKVKVWREHRGISLRELAAKADISPSHLSQIEGGTLDGTFETMTKIAAALGITVDELA